MQLANMNVGDGQPLFIIAGPCVIETEALIMSTAEILKRVGEELGIGLIFKSSFDKANRSSIGSYRGPGIEEGLRILQKVKTELDMPVLTDVHEDTPLDEVASVVDVMQTPAFLCRQTNFIVNVCEQGIPVNIKKGQFLAPLDMLHVAKKALSTGNQQVMVCERGASFGYNNLVSDMRSLALIVKPNARWCMTRLTLCRCPVVKERPRVGSVRWCRCWRGPLSPLASTGCLWSVIRIQLRLSPMDRTLGRWRWLANCSNNLRLLMRRLKPRHAWKMKSVKPATGKKDERRQRKDHRDFSMGNSGFSRQPNH